MNKKIAFIFPGQGAQYVGMGKQFYEAFPEARAVFDEAGDHLKKIIFEGPMEELTQTAIAQVAIFVTSVAILRCIPIKPDVCAGLSLGEYTALVAAGRVDFASALKLVAARGKYMQEACEMEKGSMRVVLGLEESQVAACLSEGAWIANLNCPGQVVIAGNETALHAAEEKLKAAGARRVLPLEVSGAFHTPLMRPAQEKLQSLLLSAPLQSSDVELVMNVPGAFVQGAEEMRQNLIAQVASPTRWEKGIRAMMEAGVTTFIEIGPGKTLSGMNKKIGVGETFSVEKPADLAQLEALYATAQR
ncbi:MAG: ACP S-malonyltransferase [Verrucomicrobia bacterium]|nr:ACP S-malonyltransferase [Verrucomicrobiota bacterium]